jgi:hypothetical protein
LAARSKIEGRFDSFLSCALNSQIASRWMNFSQFGKFPCV